MIKLLSIKIKHHWPNVIDFLASNLIIALVFTYKGDVLQLLSPQPYPPPFIDLPKPYTVFIEGLMAGVLIGVYIFFKKKINVSSVILGMWLYPYAKFKFYRPLDYGIESWLSFFAELSMFIGIFCALFHFASIIQKARKTDLA